MTDTQKITILYSNKQIIEIFAELGTQIMGYTNMHKTSNWMKPTTLEKINLILTSFGSASNGLPTKAIILIF